MSVDLRGPKHLFHDQDCGGRRGACCGLPRAAGLACAAILRQAWQRVQRSVSRRCQLVYVEPRSCVTEPSGLATSMRAPIGLRLGGRLAVDNHRVSVTGGAGMIGFARRSGQRGRVRRRRGRGQPTGRQARLLEGPATGQVIPSLVRNRAHAWSMRWCSRGNRDSETARTDWPDVAHNGQRNRRSRGEGLGQTDRDRYEHSKPEGTEANRLAA